jgi:hypothetical protein
MSFSRVGPDENAIVNYLDPVLGLEDAPRAMDVALG